ncbi:MAG: universal stress protein [Roseiflexus sp.]|jgi:nucleotide-binding universal stress UspA family protein|nr:universal stress protein [Roseiflexus sp.]MBO9333242.1 universal stress protein [Roseiflexus sp.]MBO9365792.1 universal stress protein [Roseiflexus sp.]MBO9383701.1 universal stress protein [Roseiflexus sp.]MBO9383755.1 universal stress protein [Roseiflexus sp.]
MHTIVVPLDGSELSTQVLPYVRTLAPLLDAHVHLLRVVRDTPSSGGESWAQVLISVYGVPESDATRRNRHDDVMEELRQQAQAYLDAQAQTLRSAGIEVTSEVRTGSPAETIVEVAAARIPGALIAMATHGYSGLRRWALGSVADKVIHAADVPVLLVRGQAHQVVQPPRRILTPLDGSGLSRQALPLASEIARAARAELILLRAVVPMIEAYIGAPVLGRPLVENSETLNALREYALDELKAEAASLRAKVPRVLTRAIIGYPAEVIIDEAREMDVDLIVMATHGYSGLRRWALGSVADKVLHATTTPLILVRASE